MDQAVDDFFDGDRVGRFDYALQAAGAKVVPSFTSEPYTPRALAATKSGTLWVWMPASAARPTPCPVQMSLDGASRLEVQRAN